MSTYSDAPNRRVAAANGIDYAYRDVGEGAIPLVLLQHFRGNLDNWDPALIDALASRHRVVTFDNVGVGATTGRTPGTVEQMGRDAIEFMTAMGFDQVDLLGFSIGSFVAQEVVLTRPSLVRRLVLASSAPKGAAGMHGWAARSSMRSEVTSPTQKVCSRSSTPGRQPAAPPARSRSNGSPPGQTTAMSPPRGRPALHSTTPCASGVPRTTRSSKG